MMQAVVTINSVILMISIITVATQVELNIDDISPRNVRVGRLLPRNPYAIIGQMFQAWCVLDRRKLLRSLNITIDDVFFRFSTIKDQTPVTVPRKYMTTVNQSTVQLKYPNITIAFHRGIISCVARVNQSSVLFIDDHLLYAGYSPGVGHVVKVITEDLVTVRVTFATTHANPSYPTTFTLLCRFREHENFSNCPNQTALSNDTIEFLTRRNPEERFGDNQQPIAVLVKSSSLLGGTAVGGLTTFSLYEKFKPQPASDIVVKYSGGQTTTVHWMYPDSVPLGLQYKLVVNSKWDQHPKVYTLSGAYFETGPFSVNLTGLHWATTYNVSVLVKPVIKGYLSDLPEVIQFTTEESIPAANPSVIRSGYERRVNDKKQNIVIYWQPVPEFFLNGIITETIVQMLVNQKIKYFTVNESDALLYQAHVRDLLIENNYLFALMIGTSKGVCHQINNTVSVPSLETALPLLENLTAIITVNTEGKHIVQLSWKPYLLQHQHLLVHWCIGRYGYKCQGVLQTFAVRAGESNYKFDNLVEPYMQYKFGASVESNSSNTGLQWVNCTYSIAEVPQKPTEIQSAEVGKHHAYIHVAPGICTLAQGYPYQLTVIIQDGDQAVVATQTFPVNPSGRYKVTSLKQGQTYTLVVYAESVKGRSNQALEIHLKTEPVDSKFILLLCIGGAIVFISAFGALCCFRYFKKCREKIEIKVPQVHDELHVEQRQLPDGYETVIPKESLDPLNQKSIQSDDDNDKEDTAEIINLKDFCCDDILSTDDNEDQEEAEQTFTGHRTSPEGNTSSSSSSVGSNSISIVLPNLSDVDTDNSEDNIEQYPRCHIQLSPHQSESANFKQLYAMGQAKYSDGMYDKDFGSVSLLDDEDGVDTGSTEEETLPKLLPKRGYI